MVSVLYENLIRATLVVLPDRGENGTVVTLGTKGFSRVRRKFLVLAEGRHIFGPLEKSLAPRVYGREIASTCQIYLVRLQ